MKSWIPALILFSLFVSCENLDTDQITEPTNDGNVKIISNSAELSARLIERNQALNIDGVYTSGRLENLIELTLIAEVLPPNINDETVMATSIDILDDQFIVSYNFLGSEYKGGVDFISNNNNLLSLESQIELGTSDVSDFGLDQAGIYYTGASSDSDSTAFVDYMDVSTGVPEIESYKRKLLGGHTATSIAVENDLVYITSGASTENGGGLHVFRKDSMQLTQYVPIADARWVEISENKVIVLGANPGKITILEQDQLTLLSEISFSGLNETGFKSTFAIEGNKLLVAARYEGIHTFDLTTGDYLSNIPLPEGSSDLYAIGVTTHDSIGYVAAGESVFLFDHSSETNEIIGRLELGNHQSINHVKYSNGYLAVASGLRGTKLIRVGDEENIVGEELLANPTFENGSDGWYLSGNVHFDPSWAGETSIAFSGGNQPVTGILSQEFSATENETASITIDYFRRGNTTLEVFGVLEVIDLYDSSVIFSDSIITPHANGRIVNETFEFTATSDHLLVRLTDHTENTISRDLYVTSLSIQQINAPANRIVRISNFEEKEISNKWFESEDGEELSINNIVEDNGNHYLQIRGQDTNGNGNIGGSWTRLARSAIAFTEHSPEEVYINFDLKSETSNGKLFLITQANAADGVLRNWINTVDLDRTDWQRISLKISDFYSNYGNFDGNVAELKVWDLSVRPTDSSTQDVRIDNLYYSSYLPLEE